MNYSQITYPIRLTIQFTLLISVLAYLGVLISPVFAKTKCPAEELNNCDYWVDYPKLLEEFKFQPLLEAKDKLKKLKRELRTKRSLNKLQKKCFRNRYKKDFDHFGEWLEKPVNKHNHLFQNWQQQTAHDLQNCEVQWHNSIKTAIGDYYAIVIGINQYCESQNSKACKKQGQWTSLRTAVNDAKTVSELLHEKYGFTVKTLLDEEATRENILKTFEAYQEQLDENDNLLIFYAGHGTSDPKTGAGYWIPVNAKTKKQDNWISGQEIFDFIKNSQARNSLVIADNCEAGMFMQTACDNVEMEIKEPKLSALPSDFQSLLKKSLMGSKILFTSSGTENATESGKGEHSTFAQPLIDRLKSGQHLTAFDLYGDIFNEVVYTASQRPRYVPLFSETEGDFIFLGKEFGQEIKKPKVVTKQSTQYGVVTPERKQFQLLTRDDSKLRKILFQQQQQQAKEESEKRCAAIHEKQRQESLRLVALSDQELKKGNITNAMLLALEGLPKTFPDHDRPYVAENEDKLSQVFLNLEKYSEHVMEGNNSINHVAFSPDGALIALVGRGGAIDLWHATFGQRLHTLIGHTSSVNHVVFSPDGEILATASDDNTARLWFVSSGKLIQTLRGHESGIGHAAFSPDGGRLATASSDKTARLWDVKSGKLIQTLRGHTNYVLHAAFSPDGGRLATASRDRTARLWAVPSGKLIQTLRGHEHIVKHAAFSPDGGMLATASDDKTARLWEIKSGKLIQTLRGHTNWVMHADFSPDGLKLATTSMDGTARIWPLLSTQKLIDEATKSVPRCLTPKQRQAFFLSDDPNWKLIEKGEQLAKTGQIQAAIDQFQRAQLQAPCLKFDPNDKARRIAAKAFFEEGKALAKQGKIQDAVVKFTEATRVDSRLKFAQPENYAGILAKSASNGYAYYFTNNCKYPVRLAIRFKNFSDSVWRTDGWWNIEAGKKTYLTNKTEDIRLKSKKTVWY